jgi:hypothetical protein
VRLPPCEEDGYPESAPGGGYPEAGGGAFAAPPQTGAAVQASGRVGIRGFALRLPEIRLEMPTLELPSIIHSRRAAHMELDGAIAPYVQVPTTGYGQTALAMRQVAVSQREVVRQETAEQPEEEQAPETGADEFHKRCAQLDALHAQLQMKQQCLDQKLMQVDSLLRELERSRCPAPGRAEAIAPAAPMPRENLPMPANTSAREPVYESTPHAAPHAPTNRVNNAPNPFLRAIGELPLLGGQSQ